MSYEIYHDDCLVKMKEIPDKSIDMILCDLPYGTTDAKWDLCLPMSELWDQYVRVIKDNCVIVLFGQEPFSSKLRLSNESWYKYDWIWEKNRVTNFLHAKNRPLKSHELISVFSSGVLCHNTEESINRMNYYPQGIISCNKFCKNTDKKRKWNNNDNTFGRRLGNDIYAQTTTNYPKSILKFSNNNNNVDVSLHPTQKPVKLLEYLIKTYTLESQTVLDNCMGSGSTGVACLNTNRRFIGIEKVETFFNIAKERLESHKKVIDTNIEQFFVE